MTEEKMTNKEHNFISLRIAQAIDNGALFAANWGVSKDDYILACVDAYEQMQVMLNYTPKPYPIATEE